VRGVNWFRAIVLAVALCGVGCGGPAGTPMTDSGPRTRCIDRPGHGETYSSDRPLFFFFCVQSP